MFETQRTIIFPFFNSLWLCKCSCSDKLARAQFALLLWCGQVKYFYFIFSEEMRKKRHNFIASQWLTFSFFLSSFMVLWFILYFPSVVCSINVSETTLHSLQSKLWVCYQVFSLIFGILQVSSSPLGYNQQRREYLYMKFLCELIEPFFFVICLYVWMQRSFSDL